MSQDIRIDVADQAQVSQLVEKQEHPVDDIHQMVHGEGSKVGSMVWVEKEYTINGEKGSDDTHHTVLNQFVVVGHIEIIGVSISVQLTRNEFLWEQKYYRQMNSLLVRIRHLLAHIYMDDHLWFWIAVGGAFPRPKRNIHSILFCPYTTVACLTSTAISQDGIPDSKPEPENQAERLNSIRL